MSVLQPCIAGTQETVSLCHWPPAGLFIRFSNISTRNQTFALSVTLDDMSEPETATMVQKEDFCSYQTVITVGFLTFSLVNYLTKYIVPREACHTMQQQWKWRNVATSFVHSFITGLWAPICFYQVNYFRLNCMTKYR